MPYDPTKDRFGSYAPGADAPSRNVIPVVPSDTEDLPVYARTLYIGGAGDLAYIPLLAPTDTPVLMKNRPVGECPHGARRVMATGTTATNILAVIS